MAALNAQYLEILRERLRTDFVPHLPALIDTTKPQPEQERKQLSRALSAFALSKLCGVNPQEAAQAVVDDFFDKGIDAIFFHAAGGGLYLVQAKLKETEQFQLYDGQAFAEGVRRLLKQQYQGFNANVQNRKTEIEGAFEACNKIQLVIVYTGDGASRHGIEPLEHLISDFKGEEERLAHEVIHISPDKLRQYLLGEHEPPRLDDVLLLADCQNIGTPRKAFLGRVKLEDLVNLYKKHGRNLYEKNIRYFLGSNNSEVNRSIQETLLRNPREFFFLNNGITALGRTVELRGNAGGGLKRVKIEGLTIINGAQTIASAAEFTERNVGADISEAYVTITLIEESADTDFGKSVTKARNHQNPVLAADFVSQDPVQERLRRELALQGIEYHYRSEVYLGGGSPNVIRLGEAAEALALFSRDPRYSVWLKSEPGRILDINSESYKALFDDSLTGALLANAVFHCRTIFKRLASAEASSTGEVRGIHRHGKYAIAWCFMKQVRETVSKSVVINELELATHLSREIDEIRQEIVDAAKVEIERAGSGISPFFRNQTRLLPFLDSILTRKFNLSDDLILASIRVAGERESYPKRVFDYLTSKAPKK